MRFMLRRAFSLAVGNKVKYINEHVMTDIKGQPTIISPNHVSFIDGVTLALSVPLSEIPMFAINTEQLNRFNSFWKNPLGAFFLSAVELVPIDSKGRRETVENINKMIDAAKQGRPVFVFPEGRLAAGGHFMGAEPGTGVIIDKADAQVVPVHLDGFQHSKGQSKTQKKAGYRRSKAAELKVTFLPPTKLDVETTNKKQRKDDLQKQLDELMRQNPVRAVQEDVSLTGMLHEARNRHGSDTVILEDHEHLEHNGEGVTYNDLLTKSYFIGKRIAAVTKRQENVGFMLPNSVGGTATFFGMQAYGRVPAMLNAKAGLQTLQDCCKIGDLKKIVTSKAFVEKAGAEKDVQALEDDGVEIVYLEDLVKPTGTFSKLAAAWEAAVSSKLRRVIPKKPTTPCNEGHEPAILLFTSGSTGAPKGVMHSSHTLVSNIEQLSGVHSFSPNEKIFNAMPTFHSFGLSVGMLTPLLKGTQSVQFPSPLESTTIPPLLYGTNSTVFFGTDTFLKMYMRAAKNRGQERYFTGKTIYTGAERLSDEVRNFYTDCGATIFEGYGATELAPSTTINVLGQNKPGTIGRTLPGIDFKLLETPGFEGDNVGELLVKGANVGEYYLKIRDDGSIEKTPITESDGYYHTGDIVRMDDDGFFTIAGRLKRFAKIGGEMVPLDRLEQLAQAKCNDNELTGEDHAAISVTNTGSDEKEKMVLFTTLPDLTTGELSQMASAQNIATVGLSKVEIITLPEIPKLGTGKTDYRHLTERYEAGELHSLTGQPQSDAHLRQPPPP
jgi:acyl-[acyl-carrier-protein]-phospholipid O-acyltransferase/long-chain-fatty-acid--[acyl-carrier-protein] ligase